MDERPKSLAQRFFLLALLALCLGSPSASAAPDDEILASVTAWAKAWSTKDVEGYLAFYAPAFQPPGGQTREAWETQRRARVAEPRSIEVSISDFKVVRREDGRAAASFRQRYRSDRYQDYTRKTLELVRDGERWLIVEERVESRAAQAGAAIASERAADSGFFAALGHLRLLSALGEPLRAEVELGALRAAEREGLGVRLASPDTYRQAGIEFNPALIGVEAAIQQREGKSVIALTTGRPVNEPFLKLLIELETKSGRLVREYTVLLELPAELPAPPARAAIRPSAPAAAAPPPPPAPAAPSAKAPAVTTALEYEVVEGDTLAKIARKHRHAGVTFDQMLIAMYRANPEAFVRNNINLLAAGRILKIPDRDAVAAVDPEEARLAVRGGEGGRAAPEPSKDQVKIPRAAAEKPSLAAAASEDDRVARERALKETQSRIEELEKSAADLKKLIEIRNLQIAELERRTAEPRPAPAPQVAKPAVEAPKPALEAPKPVPMPKPPAKQRPAPPPPAPEPSLVDEYLGGPLMLGGLGGMTLLLAGYGAYAWRRKKRAMAAQFQDTPAAMTAGSAPEPSITAASEAKGSSATGAAGEGPDVLAEADVYMAYGRDRQAEEILREALQKDAGRPIVHLRLLQIYARRQDTKEFEATALRLKGLVNGEGPEWENAMALGRLIDPGNALYGQGEAGEVAPRVGMTEVPSVDFDLDAMASPAQAQGAGSEAGKASSMATMDFDIGGTTSEEPVVAQTATLAPGAAPIAGGIDFSAISLDLGEPASPGASPGGGGPKSQDIGLKLDLAMTHKDIGDIEGARELLNEVLRDGDAEQKAQAKQMLASLG